MQAGDELNLRGLAAKAAHDALRRNGGFLDDDRREDLISYLVVVGLTARAKYDPGYGQAETTFLYRLMRVRVVDWYRQTLGDSRFRDPATDPRSAVATDLPVPVYDAPESFGLAVNELSRGLTDQARDTLSKRSRSRWSPATTNTRSRKRSSSRSPTYAIGSQPAATSSRPPDRMLPFRCHFVACRASVRTVRAPISGWPLG